MSWLTACKCFVEQRGEREAVVDAVVLALLLVRAQRLDHLLGAVGVDVELGELGGDPVDDARADGAVDFDVHVGGGRLRAACAQLEGDDRRRVAILDVEPADGRRRAGLLLDVELEVQSVALVDSEELEAAGHAAEFDQRRRRLGRLVALAVRFDARAVAAIEGVEPRAQGAPGRRVGNRRGRGAGRRRVWCRPARGRRSEHGRDDETGYRRLLQRARLQSRGLALGKFDDVRQRVNLADGGPHGALGRRRGGLVDSILRLVEDGDRPLGSWPAALGVGARDDEHAPTDAAVVGTRADSNLQRRDGAESRPGEAPVRLGPGSAKVLAGGVASRRRAARSGLRRWDGNLERGAPRSAMTDDVGAGGTQRARAGQARSGPRARRAARRLHASSVAPMRPTISSSVEPPSARRSGRRAGNSRGLIAVTGYGQEHDRAGTRAAGFEQHLTKPVAVDELIAVIEER